MYIYCIYLGAICVTTYEGELLPKENYLVGAGKKNAKYKEIDEPLAQYSEVIITAWYRIWIEDVTLYSVLDIPHNCSSEFQGRD